MGMNSEERIATTCERCEKHKNNCEFQEIVNLQKAGLIIYHYVSQKETVNKKTGILFKADNNMVSENVFILQNTKDIEIKSNDFIPELEQNSVFCPKCRKIIETARKLLDNVTSIDKKDVTGICDHCKKRARTHKSCAQCVEVADTFTKRNREEKDDLKDRFNLWLSKIKNVLKDVAPGQSRAQKIKRYYARSDTDIKNFNDEGKLLTDRRDLQTEIEQRFKGPGIFRKQHINMDLKTDSPLASKFLFPPVDDETSFKMKSTGKTDRSFHDRTLFRKSSSAETLNDKKQLFEENEKSWGRNYNTSQLEAVDLIPEIYDYIASSKPAKKRSDSKPTKIVFKGKDTILQRNKEESRTYLRDSQETEDYSRGTLVVQGIDNMPGLSKSQSGLENKYSLKYEVRGSAKPGLLKTHSEGNVSAINVGFDFRFPKLSAKDEIKIKRKISSSELVKETQNMLLAKAEEEKKRLENVQRKKLEDEEKRRIALEKNNKLKEIRRKAKEEEEKRLGEVKWQSIEDEVKLREENQKFEEELTKEKNFESVKLKSEIKVKKSTIDQSLKQSLPDVKSEQSKSKTQDIKVDKSNEKLQPKEERNAYREIMSQKKGKKERLQTEIASKFQKDKENPLKEKEIEKSDTQREEREEKSKRTDIRKDYKEHEVNPSVKGGKMKNVEKSIDKEDILKYREKSTKDKLKDKNNKLKVQGKDESQITNEIKKKVEKFTDPDKQVDQKIKPLFDEVKKEQENEKTLKTKQEENERKIREAAENKTIQERKIKEESENKAMENEILAMKRNKEMKADKKIEQVKDQLKPTKKQMELGEKDFNLSDIKVMPPSPNDLILDMVRLKQSKANKAKGLSDAAALELFKDHLHHKCESMSCLMCLSSNFELDMEEKFQRTVEVVEDIIVGQRILKHKHSYESKKEENKIAPILFESVFKDENFGELAKQLPLVNTFLPETLESKSKALLAQSVKGVEQEPAKGIIKYALSDRTFIDKGWTMLPTEKVVRKMNVYRMRPAHPEFDWFEHNKNKKLILYETGEKLAEFDDNGRGRWYYRNGNLALDYYDAEEVNAQQRFVIYSSGEPDERGRTHPITILATFDYLGNGVVFDHGGKIRLKYNQTEGVVLDRGIGPVSHWKWHTLNDPPVLQQVMIDTQMAHKDPDILKLGGPGDDKPRPDNEEMLAIEFDNFIKEKSKKLSQTFKPFQIKMKALKINEHFSLKVLDQATVYLIFRDGSANLKLNIGMILDHKEIVDTDTADVGDVSNSLERFPARTESLARLQRSVAYARRFERTRTERERRLRPPEPCNSADQLTAAISKPLRPPFGTAPSGSSVTRQEYLCKCNRKPSISNLYYDTRFV